MNVPNPNPGFAAQAAHELAQLQALVEDMRLQLASLRTDVADAESRLGSTESARIVEANEQLVLAALRSQAAADTAAQALQDMSQSSHLDALTGLPNRALLDDRLAQALAYAKRRNARLALLFLDLNDFKHVNDSFGHAMGDEVLMVAAQRLSACVRETDTVSRYGGDEFVILLADVLQAADATQIARKMIAALAAPARIRDHVLRLTASIGIAIYPEDGQEADRLIACADAAMYSAKNEGPGSFVFRGGEASLEPLLSLPSLASLRPPLTHHEVAIAEHERRLGELREANEQLVMAALNAQDLQAGAEQAQRRQTDFLAVLAHELRNPLAPIRNAAATLGDARMGEAMLPKMQAVIERQVAHMTRLIDDLLDVSRVSTGKLQLDKVRIDIAAVVDAAIEACRPAMDTRLQRLTVHLPASALEVHGDAARLVQILGNLLDNASKYTPDGGEIKLSVQARGDSVVVAVADNGIGISAASLPRIFEPFVQDTQAMGFNGTGLGIGLTVVRELVEAHAGEVQASSAGTGLGSEFVVTLPLFRLGAQR
ncbi:MAG TPA: diguanylate cyclase [Caldimonas sp.]